MGFQINNNITAMSALRNVNNSSDAYAKSINRLSTGLRINNAADDPAGLIISERFRAQIGGLQQASKNAQDGINFAKTAEGALDEVNRLLRDARTLAVASANTGTLSSAQIAANQQQVSSITASITRIAQQTQFGSKKLLDGSAGVQSTVTDANRLAGLSIGGSFGGGSISANAAIVITVNTAATQAVINGSTFAASTTTVGAGSFTLNGVTINTAASDQVNDVIQKINAQSSTTNVTASWNASTTKIVLTQASFGANNKINLSDANGLITGSRQFSTASGVDAVATVTIGSLSAVFTGGRNGSDGLTLNDADGNAVLLANQGNATTVVNATVGQAIAGTNQFQVGAFANQTASLTLGNYQASQLGTGVVSGLNLSNIDLTTATGSNNALTVIDAAIDTVTRARGTIGNFQRNVLESTQRSLNVASENLSAAESNIRDVDVAQEMTNYTKLQILQQAGMSVLAQANSSPNMVLSLLR